MALLLAAMAATPAVHAEINYTVSWFGNTEGQATRHILSDVSDMVVGQDGTVYCGSKWDEGGHHYMAIKDGKFVAAYLHGQYCEDPDDAIAVDGKYVYVAKHIYNPDATRESFKPEPGKNWRGIKRYNVDGTPAPFAGGVSKQGNMIVVRTTQLENGARVGKGVNGLAVIDGKLYASSPDEGLIRAYDLSNLSGGVVGQFAAPKPGKLRADGKGNLWALQQNAGNAELACYKVTGEPAGAAIKFAPGIAPTNFAVNAKANQLLVTDGGVAQNILVYSTESGGAPVLTGTLGITGGIFAGSGPQIGKTGPGRFHNPVGVGVDAQGRLYVANNGTRKALGGGTVVESYTLPTDLSARRWVAYGLHWADGGDMSPSKSNQVFTVEERFEIDYSKPAGQQWDYKAFTLNPFKYPNDPRQFEMLAPVWVRDIQGKPFLFTTTSGGHDLWMIVYRFSPKTDGEIAIPSGAFSRSKASVWAADVQPPSGQWIWRDASGNGSPESSEFARPAGAAIDADNWATFVDSQGAVWSGGEKTRQLSRYRCKGLDDKGNPMYGYDAVDRFDAPAALTSVALMAYLPENDAMFVTGYTADRPQKSGWWGMGGSTLFRVDNCIKGNAKTAFKIDLPLAIEGANSGAPVIKSIDALRLPANNGSGIDVLLFTAELYGGKIHVYNGDNGALLGSMSAASLGQMAWIDQCNGIRAVYRGQGQVLVFAEDDLNQKVLMYQWTVPGINIP